MILLSQSAFGSGWGATTSYKGYFGDIALGATYTPDLENNHTLASSVGQYQSGEKKDFQLNFYYNYQPLKITNDEMGYTWTFSSFGFFLLYPLTSKAFFLKSPDQYPADNYYEPTALRGGLQWGNSISLQAYPKFELIYFVRFLDNGLVAFLNNSRKDLQFYTSSGLHLTYSFD